MAPRTSAFAKVRHPVVVAPVALTPLVEAGMRTILAPYRRRVRLVPCGTGDYDVGIVDLGLLPDGWRPPRGHALVGLSWDCSARAGLRARDLGVADLLGIDLPAVELVAALEAVKLQGPDGSGVPHHGDGVLTHREGEIVVLICRGISNREIADELHLSLNSVKTYIRTAYRKMGVSSRAQAVLWGLEHGC